MDIAHRAAVLVVTCVTWVVLVGCNAGSGGLTEDSRCRDWNSADINTQGDYLQIEYKKIPHLNAYSGYAEGGVTQYCSDDPGENLGVITRKVASS